MFLKLRLQIRNFFKKHKTKIVVIAVIWVIVIIINYLLTVKKPDTSLNTTYQPHEVLLVSDTKVPEKLYTPIENLIDDYIDKCNKKDYKSAYELLTEDCKEHVFDNSVENFQKYAEKIFPTKKRYSIQNYSNFGGFYIYNVKIIDDIITTGLTNSEYTYYEEKFAIKQDGEKLLLSVNDYMGTTQLKQLAEDDNTKIRIEEKQSYYSAEIYTVKITNKTDKTLVMYDGIVGNELQLVSGTDSRQVQTIDSPIALIPGETKTFKITFPKYFDESTAADEMIFNKIRILNDYTGNEESEDEELAKAETTYSITIPIKLK